MGRQKGGQEAKKGDKKRKQKKDAFLEAELVASTGDALAGGEGLGGVNKDKDRI